MATRGRRPSVTLLKPLKGRRHPATTGEPMPEGVPEPPMVLSKRHREVWDRYIEPSYWLTRLDEPKALMFTYLMREFLDDPGGMPMERQKQLRYVASELGFDPTSRARMGRAETDPLDDYK